MPGHIPYPYVQGPQCVICRPNACDARTGSTFGIYVWMADAVTPPDRD